MAEAEDVLSDAARHATIFARSLWQRHRHEPKGQEVIRLSDVAPRVETIILALFGRPIPLRIAQAPGRRSFLRRLMRRHDLPLPSGPVPATNDREIWLPAQLELLDAKATLDRFRLLALRQAMRAHRHSARQARLCTSPPSKALYIVLEAYASDHALLNMLPGLRGSLITLAQQTLQTRSHPSSLKPHFQPFEALLHELLNQFIRGSSKGIALQAAQCQTAADTWALAESNLPMLVDPAGRPAWGDSALVLDHWTGDYIAPPGPLDIDRRASLDDEDTDEEAPRSARLERRPNIRKPVPDEDDKEQGIWMIHSGEPTEHAEDPMGMQRPTDRDDQTPAEEFADSVSELAEARLVSTPERAKDVLLSDDPPEARAKQDSETVSSDARRIQYPEWDCFVNAYRVPGSTVHLVEPALGAMAWVEATLARHRDLLWAIQRRFDLLRPQRTRRRRQYDGAELDLEACIEAFADRRAGFSMAQGLYQDEHRSQRNTAVMLLIDISGSTDSWLSNNQRIIDIEREALLLVCHALEAVGDPYAVLAFSGEGPNGVTIHTIKSYRERYDVTVAQRIAALEPDRYTRAGAALRHATAMLMQEAAEHRLLLLLSDGKPNDADNYEGRYGVEDMRQAVTEARLQGIFPFCLTIDWQAADYLPGIFGAHQYALLPKPEHLPTILLAWIRRLLAS